jgi:2-oxoglutarate/2-oxoacid ferredoxin oxidoreductase subunit alpha
MNSVRRPRDNDFTIKIANVNGTGSASANSTLMKVLFRMGIPVSGKNFFPSNIQGLPTWYEIRVSGDGHIARSGRVDIMVAMNAETYKRDHAEVTPGGYLIYDSTWPRSQLFNRTDIQVLGVPLSGMCNENFNVARSRILMKNIMYVGVLAALLDLDMEIIKGMLNEQFSAKAHLLEANQKALNLGYRYASDNFQCPLPFRARSVDRTKGHIMVDGNTTAALGCLFAGATVGAWYPITPSTSLMDAFKKFCEKFRKDPETGKANYCILQAEDELAAAGMVLGAGWNGARAFTPTSGPGISLMSEFLGYAYYTETPMVLFDVQRCGPSTGMPTRTQQADIMACAYASHGDTRHVLLFPSNPEEAFYHAVNAFDLAERLQTPVIVLTDLDIGMNDWMCRDLQWDDNYTPDRGKVLTAEQLAALPKFHRYLDADGDGIAARSLPGVHPKGAFFTRGSGHNQFGGYTEDSAEYQQVVDRLLRKWDTAKTLVPAAEILGTERSRIGFLTIGSCDGAVKEAREMLAAAGVAVDYLRVRGFPFGQEVQDFLDNHDRVYVVEQNRDAQLRSLLLLETRVSQEKLVPVLHYNGLPIDAGSVLAIVQPDIAQGKAA